MLKLHLGSGPHVKEGWINYDIGAHPGVVQLDLSKGKLPHVDGSVDYIFGEHEHEHFTYDQGLAILKECYRVLKPRGVIRISCPDLTHLCRAYIDGNLVRMPGVWEPNSLCQMVNDGMRAWGHQYLYDFFELEKQLKQAGFKFVNKQRHCESIHPELSNLEVRPFYNDLIVEAQK